MIKDYKHRAHELETAQKKPTRWVLFAGLVGFVVLTIYLYQVNADRNPATPPVPSAKKPIVADNEVQQARYTYFTLLKDRQKLVTGDSDNHPSSAKIYHLQSRVFALHSDAEKLKKTVVELGFEARTNAVLANDKKQFQVLLGPYTNQQARDTMHRLRLQGYDTTMGEQANPD